MGIGISEKYQPRLCSATSRARSGDCQRCAHTLACSRQRHVKKFVSLRQAITGFRELARAAHEPQHILPLLARAEPQFDGYRGYVTVHPSYLLRIPDEADKRRAYAGFRHDLERIRELAAG